MIRLSLASVETCIMAAYYRYLTTSPGNITVMTPEGEVTVTCVVRGTQFDCGFPGYYMADANLDGLREWCITHPGDGWSFGFRGKDPMHPDSVNIILRDKTHLLFNFHVYVR